VKSGIASAGDFGFHSEVEALKSPAASAAGSEILCSGPTAERWKAKDFTEIRPM